MLLFAVAIHPRGGLSSCGRSSRSPSQSYAPVPGTGSRPSKPRRFGAAALTRNAMAPSADAQTRLVGGLLMKSAFVRQSRALVA